MKLLVVVCAFLSLYAQAAIPQFEIIKKRNQQTLGKNCSATREWIEVRGLPNDKAANRINQRIRKELTVGKKLQYSDCPGDDSKEEYSYFNSAELTGKASNAIGIEVKIVFPGGLRGGHGSPECLIFSLQSGRSYDFQSLRTEEGKKLLRKKICEAAKEVMSGGLDAMGSGLSDDVEFCEAGDPYAYFCLSDHGIEARVPIGKIAPPIEVPIEKAEARRFFRWPKDITPP